MELDWRNRCVCGERLEDLCNVIGDLGATDDEELYDLLWERPDAALPFHRALLRVSAELLWQRATDMRRSTLRRSEEYSELSLAAFDELLRRAGIELRGGAGTI